MGYIVAAICALALISSIVWGAKALYTDILNTGKALNRAEIIQAENRWKEAYEQRTRELEALEASINQDNSPDANGPVPLVIQSALDGVRQANEKTYNSSTSNTTGAGDE